MKTIEKSIPVAAAILLSFSALAASAAAYACTSQLGVPCSANPQTGVFETSLKKHPDKFAPISGQNADSKYGVSAAPFPNEDGAPFPVSD